MKKMRGGDYMEPNKELKFGTPKGKKPKRRRAGDGDTVQEEKPFLERAGEKWSTIKKNMKNYGKNSSYGQSDAAKARKANVQSNKAAKGNAAAGAGASSAQSNVKSKVDSKGNQMIGTDADIKKMESMKAKSNPYSKAKKRDANLDSYIKQRNAAEKGSLDYNEAQNKINKAYGKGPTNRRTTYGPEKKGENITQLNKRGPAKMDSNAREFTLQTKMTSTKTPTPAPKSDKESKIEARTAKKVGKIQDRRAKATARKEDRADNKNNRSADRQFAKNERQGARADRKQGRMDDRDDRKAGRQEAKASSQSNRQMNKEARSIKRDNIKATRAKGRAEKAAARKMLNGGPRKKAFLGAAKTIAGAVGKLAPEGSKLGNIANTVSGVLDNPLQAGINAIKGQPIAGGQQPAAQAPAAAPAAAPAQAPAAQPDPNAQPQARYGRKKKGKKGMMKYKAGGAKPDYLDMDKDGNKTESMKSALKDRRKRGGSR